MRDLIDNIQNGIEVRANLIKLKEILKEASEIDAFLKLIDWDMDFFRKHLQHEDAKVRKNILQIIGICELDGLADDVFAAYQQENTLFVRSEYLKVLKNWDVKVYLDAFAKQQRELMEQEEKEEMAKHTSAELRLLSDILKQYGRMKKHQFIGGDTMSVMILTTLSGKEKYLKDAIDRTIGEGKTTLVRGGVKVVSSDYDNLMKVRCFQEMLFVLPKATAITGEKKGEQIANAGIVSYLEERLSGNSAISFRLDVRGALDADEKAKLIRNTSKELEYASKNRLVNAPSDYEVEIRLMKKKSEKEEYAVYLKIPLLKDERFAYRKNALATSIQPYVAAMMMEIAAPYIEGRGQVLDPFCGVGTLLMERNYKEHAHSIYGVDIYKEAIVAAGEHAKRARMDIHYVQKDMAEFTHGYLFDLLVTNPPVPSQKLPKSEIVRIYQTFFDKCREWLKEEAVLVIYSQAADVFAEVLKKNAEFQVLVKTDIYKKKQSVMYVLRYIG